MTDPVYILGAGMHPWGKWGRNFTEYGVVAARAALRDAGTTMVTEIDGSIIAQIPQFEAGVLRAEVRPAHGQTPYLRFGSWPMYALAALLLGLALVLRPRAHPWARQC